MSATSAPLLLDLSHTSHTRARTGVQRVTRSLWSALGGRAIAITHDPHRDTWRTLAKWEHENLETTSVAAGKRRAVWPIRIRIEGRAQRLFRRRISLPANSGLLVPEIFSPAVARTLPDLAAQIHGPRVALFHDAIALKLPEFTPTATVARFPAYLRELLEFDGIAAVSEDSRASLVDYWRWLGVTKHPAVRTISLGHKPQPSARDGETSPITIRPIVLSIATIEGRKNHLALLEACERLWQRGEDFTLHLIGLAHPRTGSMALAKIRALQNAGRPLQYDGPVSDRHVDAAYAACTFSVYPSLLEGFGLPVIESLAHGKPCVCSGRGALGESTRGGGCIALDSVDADALTHALARLLHSPADVARLTSEARRRHFKTWAEYADQLVDWIQELRETVRTRR